MKILVCTDGSESSKKAYKKAAEIAEGCQASELAIIHGHQSKFQLATTLGGRSYTVTEEEKEIIRRLFEEEKQDRNKLLEEAREFFEGKGLKARTILKEGHPAHTIVEVASAEGFDMIIIGSRGLGGLKKMFLGSVSNSVLHDAHDCSVLVVK
jgi:nucleotide-binding universal stress UspA family protein